MKIFHDLIKQFSLTLIDKNFNKIEIFSSQFNYAKDFARKIMKQKAWVGKDG